MRLTSEEEREVQFRDQAIDSLVDLDLTNRARHRFDPKTVTGRVWELLNLPGKEGSGCHKLYSWEHVHGRAMRKLKRASNGLRWYIPVGGGLWQWASAAPAREVRAFRDSFTKIERDAGARKEALDERLAEHEALGRTDDEPIGEVYEQALGVRQAA